MKRKPRLAVTLIFAVCESVNLRVATSEVRGVKTRRHCGSVEACTCLKGRGSLHPLRKALYAGGVRRR